ncbi:50S ribosomal protein L10 [Candidatus Woesebacteria bacterium]|nr:50S ribosomal protein L10 [Candidatus Woesebacteria bacterium]
MKRSEKPIFVDNLAATLKDATCVVMVDYAGLSVSMLQDLKRSLREVGSTMTVIKNTLLKRAGETAKLDSEAFTDEILAGPTAIVVTEKDPIAPLQVLAKFSQANEIPQFKVGIVEGSFRDKDTLNTLSQLPPKEVLVAQAIGAIGAPLYGIVGVLNANMQNLLSILKQASEKSQ